MRHAWLVLPLFAACSSPTPAPQGPDVAASPDAAPAPPKACAAAADECCEKDGTIVKAHCSPLDNGPRRGEGGWCEECNLRCLPGDARIATPSGDRAVSSLRPGDAVWTLDAAGARVAQPVVRISSIPAPGAHETLRIALSDGRVVVASAGHPTADGRTLAALRPGASLDGAQVTAVSAVPLSGGATWDLLPAGTTGVYWADGVLLSSTLVGD